MVRYALLAFLLTGCVGDSRGLPLTQVQGAPEPKVQFLGVGGYLINWRGEGLLIAPLFSHPSLLGFPPFTVEANKPEIDQRMPAAGDVTMLLIGHGHYDHLLDVPWIMQKHAPLAIAYGSRTVGHILRAEIPPCRIVDAEAEMAKVQATGEAAKSGTWFYSAKRNFRAMPIQSMHAPHVAGITLADGGYDQDLAELPSAVWNWKQGQVLAWLVDLLDDQRRPVYRIHYLDSASSPPYGMPPVRKNDKRVDVQILAVSSWRNVHNYPVVLLKTIRPRLVVLGHWENFIGTDPSHAEPMPLQGVEEMVELTLKNVPPGTSVKMPLPLTDIPLPEMEVATVAGEADELDQHHLAGPKIGCPAAL